MVFHQISKQRSPINCLSSGEDGMSITYLVLVLDPVKYGAKRLSAHYGYPG